MSWERRGVAVAAATPVSIVCVHAAATLQAAWVGPALGSAAPAMVLPVVAAGLVYWLKPSWVAGGLAAGVVVAGLAEDIELGSVDPATCIDDRRSCQDPVISRRRVEE